MIENLELEQTINKLGFAKEDYLFLTIKTVYLYHMKSGEKNVEYREPGDFILSRLYKDFRKNKFSEPKELSHVLFQAGYNPDSPRMLIELRGWNHQGENHPKNLNTSGHEIDRYSVNLLLGKIEYENLDMSREQEFLKKSDREYASAPKSAVAKAALQQKLSARRSIIHKGSNRKR
ncbi:hypothetical protein QGN23_12835 [Chryseobacterium gotjawalense]|uniref:Uncharacterized protein n=1 Tax=Chryseobacterium gotjawalense TaxID=3042315 RepID=A0ABY8RE34_9FLAO|nr:hypothetical protein [Chryseobacterium sp. wdc7]WHF51307.1 hypothetical protein QGN23_12835 [Chryseobacterium sp. wdc7]